MKIVNNSDWLVRELPVEMLLVESEHYSHAYFFQLVHILVNASRFDVDIQKSLYKDHPRMHVHHQHFWYVKVSDRAENFKN